MTAGLAYDSDEARGLCGVITALLHGAACHTSTELAAAVGPFDDYEKNREPMLHVMEMHWEKVEEIKGCPKYLQEAARDLWDKVLAHGKRHGFRNAQATVLAPTGTISFMMDCDTTGIEPDIALVKYKQLAGGGMLKIVNQDGAAGPADARLRRARDRGDRGLHRQARHDRRRAGAEARAPAGVRLCLPAAERQAVDRLAGAHPDDGGRAAVHLRGDLEDGEHAEGEHAGRRGRRLHGRLAAGPEGAGDLPRRVEGGAAAVDARRRRTRRPRKLVAAPRRERLPDTRQSITHKFSISGHEGYITVGLYPDGRPGELFITMAKEGSTIGGLMDCFGTAVSMSLQYGVPLEVYVNKFSHTRFEPMGFTKNPDIKIAKSLVDYIFRWLGITFLPGFREANKMVPPVAGRGGASRSRETRKQSVGPPPRWPAGRTRPKDRPSTASSPNGSADGVGQRAWRAEARREAQRHARPAPPRWTAWPVAVLAEAARVARFRAASSSPRSRPTPRPATTAARSPSATATATSATTAAAAWAVRREEGGRRKAEGGKWKAESGRRKAEGGRRKAEGGRRSGDSAHRATTGCYTVAQPLAASHRPLSLWERIENSSPLPLGED